MYRTVRTSSRALVVLALLALPTLVGAVEVGQPAPDFSLPRLDGGQSQPLAALKGKVVVLDFWASWCQPCVKTLPELDALQRELASKGVAVLAVTIDEDAASAKRALGTAAHAFTVLHDPDMAISERYGIGDALPATVVIDRQGRVQLVQRGGSIEPGRLRRAIESLL